MKAASNASNVPELCNKHSPTPLSLAIGNQGQTSKIVCHGFPTVSNLNRTSFRLAVSSQCSRVTNRLTGVPRDNRSKDTRNCIRLIWQKSVRCDKINHKLIQTNKLNGVESDSGIEKIEAHFQITKNCSAVQTRLENSLNPAGAE